MVDQSGEQAPSTSTRWLPWLTKGSLAIADQGIFAVSNFLLNVLLARWLAPDDYGAFALAYSVFLLLLVAHSALVTTPMLVFGQGKFREHFPEYLGILVRGHFALVLPGSALLVAAAFLLGSMYSAGVERAFLALAAASPFILLLWLLRRAFYAKLDPAWAAASGVVYFALLAASATELHAIGLLSPSTGFLSMGAASLITSVLLLARLRPKLASGASTIRAVVADHWSYGKWVAAGAGPNWITDNIYFLVLPAWLGLAEVGAFKALLNLAQPASQSITAFGTLLMPILVRDREAGGPERMKGTMKLSLVLFVFGSLAYLALLWGFRFQIFHSLYGGKFTAYDSWPVLVVGLLPIAQSLPNVAGAALGALERPKLGFWADAWSATWALVAGLLLAFWLGVGGALVGVVSTYTLMGFVTLFFLNRSVRRDRQSAPSRIAAMPANSNWPEAS